MRGKRRIFGLAALLSVLLAVPLVFSFGIINLPKFSSESSSSTALIYVDPAQNVTDYEDPVHNVTIGSTVTFHIDIFNVTDLFTWQINMSWDPSILNMSNIIAGELLADPQNTSSEELGWVVNSTDNSIGYSVSAETILGNVTGITEPNTGRLVSIEFLIVGYGWTYLNISVSGTLPTTLLDSAGGTIAYYRQLVPVFPSDGYFRNVILGDLTDDSLVGIGPPDGDVDGFDLGIFSDAFGASFGQPEYYHLGDLTDDSLVGIGPPDGDVDGFDLGVFSDNFGRP